jgi:hypothetical protein
MKTASLLVLLAVGCTIDDRQVAFRTCAAPPADGLLSNFSAARARSCPTGYCAADLVGSPSVSLGEGKIYGLVFPYASPGVGPVALGLAPSGAATDAGTAQALRISTPAYPADGAGTPDGFALRFGTCIDTKGYTGLSFTTGATAADVGTCPLRFAPEFLAQDAGTAVVQSLDQSDAAPVVPVTAGTTTLVFSGPAGVGRQSTALAGMQWELTLPGGALGCSADFTIDDIRLVPLH